MIGASAATLNSVPKIRVISAAESASFVPGRRNRLVNIIKTMPATVAKRVDLFMWRIVEAEIRGLQADISRGCAAAMAVCEGWADRNWLAYLA